MNAVTVDTPLAADLTRSGELVEIRDANGQTIGFFAPIGIAHSPQYAAAAAHFYPTKDQPHHDGPWFTSEQVAEHLHSLENT